MMAYVAPAHRQIKCNTIVNVTNLGVNMTNDRLRKMFENYGTIASYGVLNDDEPSRRFAFVTFEDSDAADEAVIELNGQLIDDNRRLRVRRTRKSENNRDKPRPWSRNARKKDTEVGAPSSDAATRASSSDAATGASASDAATGASASDAATGASSSDTAAGASLGFTALFASHSRDSPRYGYSLYVQNLDRNVDRVGLRKAFENYGRILEAKVIMYRENDEVKSRGYGFVTFLHEADAQRAQREMVGRLIGTQSVHVEMARSSRPTHHGIGSLPPALTSLRLGGISKPQPPYQPRFRMTSGRPVPRRPTAPTRTPASPSYPRPSPGYSFFSCSDSDD